ncbi:conserved hypothetical protein [Frankia canadensis]|uniref:Uncharacterized protein n=1 Tax=Frankia canadensis TaxID=1836972 RepID=A0A2I2KKL9_9ACTN|nr:hypothetical protein [Frankia canadensis]SNQ46219.1 conserved hypothetical protein [Frankia canadensis]SOU53509.1 conserved hypothetical protein [Frankia canadensis]
MDSRVDDQLVEIRTCGRPTRSGKPCKVRLYGPEIACRTHLTDHERDVAEAYQRGMGLGHRRGWESGQEMCRHEVEQLRDRVRDLERCLDDAHRYHDLDGDQVVEVDGYAYRWCGRSPLRVGDRVELPENWLSRAKNGPGTFQGTVTRLGATFQGELSAIVRRVGAG